MAFELMERNKNLLNGDFRFQLFSVILDECLAFWSMPCHILIAFQHEMLVKTTKNHFFMNEIFLQQLIEVEMLLNPHFNSKIDD